MHLTKLNTESGPQHQLVQEFIQSFNEHLQHIILHDFIEKVHTSYYQHLRDNMLGENEVFVGDFAKSFTFVMQDEVQSYHWNNAQATIHRCVCYFLENGVSKHVSCVAVSENLTLDTITVHLFQQHLLKFLKEKFGEKPMKVFYFSDGCAGQYKNCKNFMNLCHHSVDFGVEAEWHFTRQGAVRWCWGLLKTIATKASLQRPYQDQIQTPHQVYEFAKQNVPSLNVEYFTVGDWEAEGNCLTAALTVALLLSCVIVQSKSESILDKYTNPTRNRDSRRTCHQV